MKTLQNIVIALSLSLLMAVAGCKKESTTTTTTDPSVHSTAMLKSYQDATTYDIRLFKYHQNAGTGSHDSCFYYGHQYNLCDSLFSNHFYEYCHTVYSNNGMMNGGEHMGGSGEWNHESGQCGLDSLHYGNWHENGNFMDHDSLMYHQMEKYGMMGHFSSQATQCYSNMQALRDDHFKQHNYHW
jgi:hypothetical protein